MQYGKFKRSKSPSPSSSIAVKEALSEGPHKDLLPPPDPMIAETARRAAITNEARELFYDGLLSHEILERYPDERHWMGREIGDWEVVFRREQLQFVENADKPAPKFNAPSPRRNSSRGAMLSLPALAIDKPHLKAVAICVEVCDPKTRAVTEEMVWFPRSQIKDGNAPHWLVGKKREELEAKFPGASFEGLPQ